MPANPPVDLLLLHPPSVYDFREKSILYGPVSDMVPSSVVFELYPIGFLTIAGYLQQRGMQVRIVNLALRMLTDRHFDARKFLASQRPAAIGIDLHWMPHCHGAIEIARLAKEVHPDVPVILGGLSATYYHEELLTYPEVDFVMRGDSTEPPLHELLLALQQGGSLEQIPNLSWRSNGEIRVNPLTFIPKTLDYIDVRPELLIEMAIRYRDFASVLPFNGWLRNPTTMVLPLKGCAFECVTCGSSATTCTHLTLRRKPVFRSPANLANNVAAIGRFSRGPIVIPGDLLQGGSDYATQVIDEIAATGVRNGICFEFFDVPPIDFVRHIDAKLPHWSFEISPESHDHTVRRAMEGEIGYDNAAMEHFLREALKLDCERIDVFYMIGLPKQTYDSVMETVDYCEHLFRMGDPRLQCFISPMGPFLDPGSRIFEEPARFGYRKFAHTLEEHRQLLVQPSWEQILNYETDWMTRVQLVDATYDAAERLNELKLRYGRISTKRARAVADGITQARRLRARLNEGVDGAIDVASAEQLHGEISRFSDSTVCDKRELFWQRHVLSFRLPAIMKVAADYLRG
ncbi:MAG TPA: TIGR04190 family B12-binding domain/radical SAM domain protein [Gammaproteobacteria bacterium]|nr:TIGR04190 family B12-binding domain/radical SAM domain protein [Gammaproteobacteria bacterium]